MPALLAGGFLLFLVICGFALSVGWHLAGLMF